MTELLWPSPSSPLDTDTQPQQGLPPIEYFSDTSIDVATTLQDVEKFKAGETVTSQEATSIAHIDFDIERIAQILEGLSYPHRGAEFKVEYFEGEEQPTYVATFSPEMESRASEEQLAELSTLLQAFAQVVIHDREANNLGYSREFGLMKSIKIDASMGAYSGGNEVYPHTDPYGKPAVKYVASFGVSSTGFIPGPVHPNQGGMYTSQLPATRVDAAGATFAPQGTVQRFVQDRDMHFAPSDAGPRLFLDTVVNLEPTGAQVK